MDTKNVKTPDFSDPRARRAWVNYQLKLSGRSLADVARELGVARHAPSLALSRPYPRMERAIAHATGVAVHILFPERYSPNGQRSIRLGRPVKKSVHKDTSKCSAAGKKREAP